MRLLSLILALALTLPAIAQESEVPPSPPVPDVPSVSGKDTTLFRVGVYAGYAVNFHETQATLFTGGGECGAFNDGRGNGVAISVFGEMPVMGEMLDAFVGVSFFQRGGTFGEVVTGGLPILDPTTSRYTQLERRHNYTADLGYIAGELGVRFTPLPEIPLYIRVTGAGGVPASRATHRQTEQILSPDGVLYPETNTVTREVSSGEIKDAGFMMAAGGAIGYPVKLGPRISAAPEVSYYYPFTDVTPHYRWRVSSAQAGVAFRWSFGKLGERPAPEPPIAEKPIEPEPPPPAEQPQVVLAMASSKTIEIVETVVTETFPILPYVFFDSASADIAPRYKQIAPAQTVGFDEQALPHRSLGAYYEMLNVIGSRLRREPRSKVTVNGTTDGREIDVPGTANNLARARAQAVKDYLVKVWDIDPARITVSTSPTPAYPSSMQYAEGAEENRRVEIITANDDILQPILFERFKEYTIEPKEIPFRAGATSGAGLDTWRMDVYADDESVWHQEGKGVPPTTMTWHLDLETASAVAQKFTGEGALRCELSVIDNEGRTASAESAQPVNKMMSPFEVSRLSLIVFDFDKADINTQNQRMISAFVSRSMQASSTSSIIGSTDRLGELRHNQELSIARAVAVRDLVLKERKEARITSVEGVGPSRLLYDNDTPEGRYYCRTVTVEVKTPINSQ